MNAAACCGLQLYNFGRTVSICFFTDTWRPDSFYDKIAVNSREGMHTLCLLGKLPLRIYLRGPLLAVSANFATNELPCSRSFHTVTCRGFRVC